MRVILPKEATGAAIAEAIKRTAERMGFSCKLDTENTFSVGSVGSVKEVPLNHKATLIKPTEELWYREVLVIEQFEDDVAHGSLEINCKVPTGNPDFPYSGVSKTTDFNFPKVEPYFKEFVGAFFEELQKAESAPV